MITVTHSAACPEQFFPVPGADPDKCVFFDIETTGFKAGYSHVYLIGAARRGSDGWSVMQWMTEKPTEEAGLLRVFAAFLKPYDTVIHFNGDRFDIPYLEEKYAQYAIPSPFTNLRSIDLYQDIRVLRPLLKMEHMNQTSMERFLGLYREDQYDGGKLIPVYHEYCKCGHDDLAQLLLLHNQEDVQGMMTLLSLYAYVAVFDNAKQTGPDPVICAEGNAAELIIRFVPPFSVPVSISRTSGPAVLELAPDVCTLAVSAFSGTLYYYFENYKEYYYLPVEDRAVHKSVGAFVDRAYRRQATAKTCYTKQEGLFLPQPEPVFTPALKRSRKDSLTWFPYEQTVQESSFLSAYLKLWLQAFLK